MAFGISRRETEKFTGPVIAIDTFACEVDGDDYVITKAHRYPPRHPAVRANPRYFVPAPDSTAEDSTAIHAGLTAIWQEQDRAHAAREALRTKSTPPPMAEEDAVIAIRRVMMQAPDGSGHAMAQPGDKLPADHPLVKKAPEAFVSVTNGVPRERAMRALQTLTSEGRKREPRTVLEGQWVDENDPMVALHPTHFRRVMPRSA